MAKHEMFLSMVLTNARRIEARAVVLSVDGETSRIDMLLLDGSSQPISAPPSDILLRIIEDLEDGQTQFQASVHSATVEKVNITRMSDGKIAYISQWNIEHVD